MKTTIITVILLIFVFTSSCDESNPVECQLLTVDELEAIVKGNCLTLIEAAEAFAYENDGYYSTSIDSDTTITGKVLIDYLPNGEKLLNPFTGLNDQPIDTIPTTPGEIGYNKQAASYMNVYFVQGYGANSIIVEHDNIEELEALVIEACLALQYAVYLWHYDNDGLYPCMASDTNIEGKTVIDYLPNGQLMINPFTKLRTEPAIWGAAANNPGEIGYDAKFLDIEPRGYTITGVGFDAGTVIITLYN